MVQNKITEALNELIVDGKCKIHINDYKNIHKLLWPTQIYFLVVQPILPTLQQVVAKPTAATIVGKVSIYFIVFYFVLYLNILYSF